MTATDQDAQAERLIEWLAKQAREICPPSLLADEVAWATRIVTAMRAEHWKCIPPPRPVELARQPGAPAEAHATELDAVRKACETASSKHHRKEDHDA